MTMTASFRVTIYCGYEEAPPAWPAGLGAFMVTVVLVVLS
jgi:hypothetical protein